MSINSIYNYIKRIENALSTPESPENQFLNVELYKNKEFNLKSFTLSIFSKISNTSKLLSELKNTIERTKNEIVEQINSNFNNYVTLISKLQTIDFLIDNINSSLENIKSKINSELDLVVKYENELTQMLNFINENDKEIKNVNEYIQKYENKIKCENLIEKIENFLKDNQSGIQDKNYTIIRKLLNLLTNFYTIKEKGIDFENEKNILINTSSEKYMEIINDILKYTSQSYFNANNKIAMKLNSNLLSLINKLFAIQKNEVNLYETIYDNYVKNEINKVFEKNITIPKVISEIEGIIDSEKYKVLINEFNNPKFLQICFIIPFINKFSNDKFLFNCSDSIQFKDNYISVLSFFNKYNIEEIVGGVKSFLQMFSFFTYFQYVQNNMSTKLLGLVDVDYSNDKDNLTIFTNCIFNYLKEIKEITEKKNIFIKNLPNFLNFILQCFIFIQKKIKNFENNSEIIKLYHITSNDNLNFEISGKDKEKIANYLKVVQNLKEYFKVDGKFCNDTCEIAKREIFLCESENEKNNILNGIKNICNEITKLSS